MDSKGEYLSIGEAAEHLGVSIDTLRRWDKKGKVKAYRSPGGHRYFQKVDLDELFDTKYERTDIETDQKDQEGKPPKEETEKAADVEQQTKPQVQVEEKETEPKTDLLEKKIEIITRDVKVESETQEIPEEQKEKTQPPIKKDETPEEPSVAKYPQVTSFSHIDIPRLDPVTVEKGSEHSENLNEPQTQTETREKDFPAEVPEKAVQGYQEAIESQKKLNQMLNGSRQTKGKNSNQKNKDEKEIDTDKKKYILIVLLILFVIVDIILAVVWYNSTKILSPIP